MHIAPISIPDIAPGDPASAVQAQVAVAAAVKVISVQRSIGTELVGLLDPNVGKHINRSA